VLRIRQKFGTRSSKRRLVQTFSDEALPDSLRLFIDQTNLFPRLVPSRAAFLWAAAADATSHDAGQSNGFLEIATSQGVLCGNPMKRGDRLILIRIAAMIRRTPGVIKCVLLRFLGEMHVPVAPRGFRFDRKPSCLIVPGLCLPHNGIGRQFALFMVIS
jgi:hypothetical protein